MLVDRRATRPPTTAFVNEMAEFFRVHAAELANTRAAIVVGTQEGFGMGRMTSILGSLRANLLIEAFHDYDAAVAWLDEESAAS
jgi:hypothetical protein